MDITDILAAPDGAVLASIAGEVALVTVRHEGEDEVRLKRFRLGSAVAVGAVLELLGAQGLIPATSAVPVQVAAPPLAVAVLSAPSDVFVCPECGHTFSRNDNLRNHRSRVHKVARGDTSCPDCGQVLVSPHALAVHRARKHAKAATSPRVTQPAVEEARPIETVPQADGPTAGVCTICARTFKRDLALRVHLERAHRGEPWSTKARTTAAAPELETPAEQFPEGTRATEVAAAASAVAAKPTGRGTCEICGRPWANHPRCDECGTLIGKGHTVEESAGGRRGSRGGSKPLCALCLDTIRTDRLVAMTS